MPKLPLFYVISDIHRDTGPFEWPDAARRADIVIVAGDMASGSFDIDFLCQLDKPVVFVPGNHEFWSETQRDMVDIYREMKQAAAGTKVHVLWDEEIQIEGVRILGTPLWTNFGEGNEALMRASMVHSRDYIYINAKSWYDDQANRAFHDSHSALFEHLDFQELAEKGAFTPFVAYSLHKKSLAFIEAKLHEPFEGPTILVSHMAPSYDCLAASGTTRTEFLNPSTWHTVGRAHRDLARVAGYASDLSNLFERYRTELDLAVHGHIHSSVDLVCGSTRVLSNPRGRYLGPLTNSPENLLFGYSPSAESIARSKAAFEEYPHWGENLGFKPHALFSLDDGLAPALEKLVMPDVPRLEELLAEVRELEPLVSHENALVRRSIHECVVARGKEFSTIVSEMLKPVARACDVEADTHPLNWWRIYVNLGFSHLKGSVIPRALDEFDEEKDPRVGVSASIRTMDEFLHELPNVPLAPELSRKKYQARVTEVLNLFRSQGHNPRWHATAPMALWRKIYRELGYFTVDAGPDEAARLSVVADGLLNENKIPRTVFVSVVARAEEEKVFTPPKSKKGSW